MLGFKGSPTLDSENGAYCPGKSHVEDAARWCSSMAGQAQIWGIMPPPDWLESRPSVPGCRCPMQEKWNPPMR